MGFQDGEENIVGFLIAAARIKCTRLLSRDFFAIWCFHKGFSVVNGVIHVLMKLSQPFFRADRVIKRGGAFGIGIIKEPLVVL